MTNYIPANFETAKFKKRSQSQDQLLLHILDEIPGSFAMIGIRQPQNYSVAYFTKMIKNGPRFPCIINTSALVTLTVVYMQESVSSQVDIHLHMGINCNETHAHQISRSYCSECLAHVGFFLAVRKTDQILQPRAHIADFIIFCYIYITRYLQLI